MEKGRFEGLAGGGARQSLQGGTPMSGREHRTRILNDVLPHRRGKMFRHTGYHR